MNNKECGTFKLEERDGVLMITFAEPTQFDEGDILTLTYYGPDDKLTVDYTIKRAG
jgi:hypothetical protein